eukprot:3893227-Rhodomonas_salina.1
MLLETLDIIFTMAFGVELIVNMGAGWFREFWVRPIPVPLHLVPSVAMHSVRRLTQCRAARRVVGLELVRRDRGLPSASSLSDPFRAVALRIVDVGADARWLLGGPDTGSYD